MLHQNAQSYCYSKEFVSANIKSIDVTAEGEPNVLFLKGIEESDLYEKNAYAAIVDFRTVNEEKVIDSGRKLTGTQMGIQLQIKKDVTTEDLKAYVFTIADSHVTIMRNNIRDYNY